MGKLMTENTQHNDVFEPWSPADLDLMKETVAKGATKEELLLFLYTAKARGLDPLLKQIYLIKRRQKRGDKWVETGVIQTGIDGFRLIANRTKKLKGIERGTKRDENGKLYAWARVWRKDWENPAYEEVSLEEYKAETPLWQRMPEQMLKKCAEAAALRMAFPEDLSGLYSHEEMDQADLPDMQAAMPKTSPQPVAPAEPDTQKLKALQVAMRDCIKTITQLQKEHGLTKDDIQWITGLDTLKGADLATLEKAAQQLAEHCQAKSVDNKSSDMVSV